MDNNEDMSGIPEPTDNANTPHEQQPPEDDLVEDASSASPSGAAPPLEEDFLVVQSRGKARRMSKVAAKAVTIIGPSPISTSAPKIQNVPPPPLELYHGNQTSVQQEERGVAVSFIKVKYIQNFSKVQNRSVFPAKDFQKLIGVLKKTDDTLMICPLAPMRDGSSNYINQPVHIPVSDPTLLRTYFSHTVTKDYVHTVFVIRTHKTLWTLKENPISMKFLCDHHISLSQTNWLAKRGKVLFFLHGASEVLTHRDDLKEAIKENMTDPGPFGLYPKRHTLVNNGKKWYSEHFSSTHWKTDQTQ